MIYGALETGGTKMVCALGTEDGKILERHVIPTEDPGTTVPKLIGYFAGKGIRSLGIASFGPLDLWNNSPTYGEITTTPKIAWRHYNIYKAFYDSLCVPVALDTDVNGSLIGECTYGQARGVKNAVYITIGTGIGGGILENGQIIHGIMHPEIGHLLIPIDSDDHYKGHCPSHGVCFEGLASGPALAERYGSDPKMLADNPKVWELEAYYIAEALVNLTLTVCPEIFILGGGVMKQDSLFPLIRRAYGHLMNSYVDVEKVRDLDHYIVPESLDGDQGILGALKMAIDMDQH